MKIGEWMESWITNECRTENQTCVMKENWTMKAEGRMYFKQWMKDRQSIKVEEGIKVEQ